MPVRRSRFRYPLSCTIIGTPASTEEKPSEVAPQYFLKVDCDKWLQYKSVIDGVDFFFYALITGSLTQLSASSPLSSALFVGYCICLSIFRHWMKFSATTDDVTLRSLSKTESKAPILESLTTLSRTYHVAFWGFFVFTFLLGIAHIVFSLLQRVFTTSVFAVVLLVLQLFLALFYQKYGQNAIRWEGQKLPLLASRDPGELASLLVDEDETRSKVLHELRVVHGVYVEFTSYKFKAVPTDEKSTTTSEEQNIFQICKWQYAKPFIIADGWESDELEGSIEASGASTAIFRNCFRISDTRVTFSNFQNAVPTIKISHLRNVTNPFASLSGSTLIIGATEHKIPAAKEKICFVTSQIDGVSILVDGIDIQETVPEAKNASSITLKWEAQGSCDYKIETSEVTVEQLARYKENVLLNPKRELIFNVNQWIYASYTKEILAFLLTSFLTGSFAQTLFSSDSSSYYLPETIAFTALNIFILFFKQSIDGEDFSKDILAKKSIFGSSFSTLAANVPFNKAFVDFSSAMVVIIYIFIISVVYGVYVPFGRYEQREAGENGILGLVAYSSTNTLLALMYWGIFKIQKASYKHIKIGQNDFHLLPLGPFKNFLSSLQAIAKDSDSSTRLVLSDISVAHLLVNDKIRNLVIDEFVFLKQTKVIFRQTGIFGDQSIAKFVILAIFLLFLSPFELVASFLISLARFGEYFYKYIHAKLEGSSSRAKKCAFIFLWCFYPIPWLSTTFLFLMPEIGAAAGFLGLLCYVLLLWPLIRPKEITLRKNRLGDHTLLYFPLWLICLRGVTITLFVTGLLLHFSSGGSLVCVHQHLNVLEQREQFAKCRQFLVKFENPLYGFGFNYTGSVDGSRCISPLFMDKNLTVPTGAWMMTESLSCKDFFSSRVFRFETGYVLNLLNEKDQIQKIFPTFSEQDLTFFLGGQVRDVETGNFEQKVVGVIIIAACFLLEFIWIVTGIVIFARNRFTPAPSNRHVSKIIYEFHPEDIFLRKFQPNNIIDSRIKLHTKTNQHVV